MTILQQNILKLRSEGKSYRQIQNELNCSRGSVSYICGDGQKNKSRLRCKRHVSKKGCLYKKLQGFCYSYGKYEENGRLKNKLIPIELVNRKIGENPTCYLTGESIDLSDMNGYSLDHIIPVSKGGSSEIDNLGLSTRQSNQCKSDLTETDFIELCKKVLLYRGYKISK